MRKSLLAALFLAPISAHALSAASLKGVDVYRSAVLTQDEAHRLFDERLRQYVSYRNSGTPGGREKAESLRLEMQGEAAKLSGVMSAELRVTEYFTSVDHAMYAVFDVVDRADASRLAFSPAPKAVLADPDGLLAGWRAYVAAGEALSRRGEMPLERPSCPGFYCLWGGKPELDAAQAAFVSGAARKNAALRQIVRAESDGDARSSALFVLSYSTSGADVVALCSEALSDSDSRVRGAALQILADVANHHPELPLPLDRILARLDDPSAPVRGKTMGLLVPLAEADSYRQGMLPSSPRLVQLLKLSHPESRDLAFTLLSILSKKNFEKTDFAAWDAWAQKPIPARR